jgi:hypothetical protein
VVGACMRRHPSLVCDGVGNLNEWTYVSDVSNQSINSVSDRQGTDVTDQTSSFGFSNHLIVN